MPTREITAATLRCWTPVLLYMAGIFALSSISTVPATPHGSDKVLHALLYAGLGALFARAMAAGNWNGVKPRHVMATIAFAAIYGASDEWHQHFNPPRDAEALDVIADIGGAAVAAVSLYAWGIIRLRNGL